MIQAATLLWKVLQIKKLHYFFSRVGVVILWTFFRGAFSLAASSSSLVTGIRVDAWTSATSLELEHSAVFRIFSILPHSWLESTFSILPHSTKQSLSHDVIPSNLRLPFSLLLVFFPHKFIVLRCFYCFYRCTKKCCWIQKTLSPKQIANCAKLSFFLNLKKSQFSSNSGNYLGK